MSAGAFIVRFAGLERLDGFRVRLRFTARQPDTTEPTLVWAIATLPSGQVSELHASDPYGHEWAETTGHAWLDAEITERVAEVLAILQAGPELHKPHRPRPQTTRRRPTR